ncbi:MAG: hypothetical protein ACT6RR_14195 [Hydrogenophaga sp.]|jgi:hypothetical protein|uniref:hypothetical protein n=1 Tax=Hydrogenophaga sp. TaxID=1904254 RepID=UPI0040368DC4
MTEFDLSLRGADGWRTGRRSFLAQAGGAVAGAIATGYPSGQVILKSGLTAERIASTQLRWT